MGLLPLEKGPQDHLFRGKLEQLFRLVVSHSGKTQMDFAALMQTNRSNVARWILQLERMELIRRTILPGTTRTYGIHLTTHGRGLALSRRFLSLDSHAGHPGVDAVQGQDEAAGTGGPRAKDRAASVGVDGVEGAPVEDGHAVKPKAKDKVPRGRRRTTSAPHGPTVDPRRTGDSHRPAKGRRRR